ncbi:hypothetical protein MAPG_08352, partial [Magnaporthiopsis poae ATCC 64411]
QPARQGKIQPSARRCISLPCGIVIPEGTRLLDLGLLHLGAIGSHDVHWRLFFFPPHLASLYLFIASFFNGLVFGHDFSFRALYSAPFFFLPFSFSFSFLLFCVIVFYTLSMFSRLALPQLHLLRPLRAAAGDLARGVWRQSQAWLSRLRRDGLCCRIWTPAASTTAGTLPCPFCRQERAVWWHTDHVVQSCLYCVAAIASF